MNDEMQSERMFGLFPPVTAAEWQEVILQDLKGADFEKKLVWKTLEGLSLMPYYRQEDLEGLSHLGSLPGEPPFVRGTRPGDNRWEIRQDIPETGLSAANAMALDAFQRGATGIGLNVSRVRDLAGLERLLASLDLGRVAVHFTGAGDYARFHADFLSYVAAKGVNASKIRGSYDYDPLARLIREGGFQRDWRESLREAAGLLEAVSKDLPGFKAITVHTHLFSDAGSSLTQELAYGLNMANEYLAGLTEAGLPIGRIAPHLLYTVAVGSDYFPEIARIRATRWLWHRVVSQYRPESEEAGKICLHATTSRWNKTIFDPYVNLLRTTTETMSAAIAGADILSVSPFDSVFRQADEFSLRVARNQQIVLQQEAYLEKVIDPAAGSYYLEKLTDGIARQAWDIFRETEAGGGFIACFRENRIQEEIGKIRRQKEADVASRKTTLLGINQYPNLTETLPDRLEIPSEETMPSGATRPLLPGRAALAVEKIRLSTEHYVKLGGRRPDVFLFTLGNLAMRKARAGFTANFFGCAGYTVTDNPGFRDVAEGLDAVMEKPASMVVICSSDEEYPELVPAICHGLREKGYSGPVVLAGYPKEILDQLKAAGIDDFIHVRSDLVETLTRFNDRFGITH